MLPLDHPDAAALRKIREELEELAAEQARLADAPLPLDEVEKRLRDELAARNLDCYLAPLRDLTIRPSRDFRPRRLEITAEMLAALETEGFVSRSMAYLRSRGEPDGAVTKAERDERLATLAKRRVELERLEELEVLRLERETSWFVLRRRDIDPALVIRIWLELEEENDGESISRQPPSRNRRSSAANV